MADLNISHGIVADWHCELMRGHIRRDDGAICFVNDPETVLDEIWRDRVEFITVPLARKPTPVAQTRLPLLRPHR